MSFKIDTQGIERFGDWFQARVKNGCPFCDSRDWTVHDEMAVTSTLDGAAHSIDARHGAPVVQVTCNQCAFTASFAATRVGLLDPDD